MSFGSFWTGIQLLELDPKTGKAHTGRKLPQQIAWNESIEAAAILKHERYYYLFVNWGLCCRGLDSTYEIRVGRSRSIAGPYLDKDGRALSAGGGSLLLGSAANITGPGHASFVTSGKETRMFFHYYDRKRAGHASLGNHKLRWSQNGWPEV